MISVRSLVRSQEGPPLKLMVSSREPDDRSNQRYRAKLMWGEAGGPWPSAARIGFAEAAVGRGAEPPSEM